MLEFLSGSKSSAEVIDISLHLLQDLPSCREHPRGVGLGYYLDHQEFRSVPKTEGFLVTLL